MHQNRLRSRVVLAWLLAAASLAGVGRAAQEPAPRQAFRAGVDVIEVDAQVIGRDGQPVPDLTADKFDVRIGGQRRRVSSVQFVRYGDPSAVRNVPAVAPGAQTPTVTPEQAMAGRRLFMVAVDALSFDPGDSRGVAVATQRFIEGLPDTDLVGLFTYPSGAKVDPTTEHADVMKALDQVSGQRVITTGRFPLQASEVVDFIAGEREPVIRRHCGESGGDPGCIQQLESEIATLGGTFEAMARSSLGMLRDMIDQLANVPGRKVLVLASAGLPVSDRPGGRPDIGDLPQRLGEAAARANVAIYTLFVDDSMLRQFASEERNARRQMVNVAREGNLLGRWLDQFSGSAGGTMIKVMVDSGEAAYAQIVRETAGHYLLAVEPDRSDRSGSSRRIQVRVNHPNTTVRARQWVVLPEE
jgi:VWFA-related protein